MKKNTKHVWVLVSCLFLVSLIITQQPIFGALRGDRDPAEVVKSVFGVAGSPATGTGVNTNGTVAQSTPIGIASGGGIVLYAGFWSPSRVLTDVELPEQLALQTALLGNSPNPFNPKTQISFSLADEGPVEMMIFNIRGELVRTLVDETVKSGYHTVTWDGTDNAGRRIAAGLYFYCLQADDYQSVKKMMLLK